MYLYESLILFVISVLLYVYWSFKKAYSFFEQNGIPYLTPTFPFGNMADAILFRKPLVVVHAEIYRKLAPHKFGGIYAGKKLNIIVRDPELIKDVLIKDFAYFHDRGIVIDKNIEPLGNHLFTMRGEEWKHLRIKLTTTFTTGKMKMMFPLVKTCGEKLNEVIDQISSEEAFDMKDLAARYTTDAIGTCAFGIEIGSLDNPNSEFRQMGRKITSFRFQTILRVLWPGIPPKLIKMFKLEFIEKSLQRYFIDIVEKTVKYREENNVTRYDFLDLLIALKNNTILEKFHDKDVEDLEKFIAQVGDKRIKSDVDMSIETLAAQCFIFFAAGFETASTTLGYLLLELSQNEQIQNRVRDEIKKVLENNDDQLTYESMKEMTYVDMVIAETLRKYPPAGNLIRQCSKNYKIPGTNVIIPAGTSLIIPIYGLHNDEKYYDNPEEFRPERFTEEEKAKRPHHSYLPFGEGPRVCIAERFGKMQVKIGLIYMLKDYSYRLSSKTKLPITFQKNFGLLTVKDGIWLHREKL